MISLLPIAVILILNLPFIQSDCYLNTVDKKLINMSSHHINDNATLSNGGAILSYCKTNPNAGLRISCYADKIIYSAIETDSLIDSIEEFCKNYAVTLPEKNDFSEDSFDSEKNGIFPINSEDEGMNKESAPDKERLQPDLIGKISGNVTETEDEAAEERTDSNDPSNPTENPKTEESVETKKPIETTIPPIEEETPIPPEEGLEEHGFAIVNDVLMWGLLLML